MYSYKLWAKVKVVAWDFANIPNIGSRTVLANRTVSGGVDIMKNVMLSKS